MGHAGNSADRSRFRAAVGLGVIFASGLLMAFVELRHLQEMSSTIGVTVFALVPFVLNVGLVAAGGLLWRRDFDGDEILRIAGWVVLGMAVVGLLATWTITHQNIRGRPFAHAPFVTVNNLSAGALIGLTVGWYDLLHRRYERQADTERARLEFLHSSLRHNVLNGMTIILGNVELLEEQAEGDEKQQLETIRNRGSEVVRFTESTNTLIDSFRSQTETTPQPTDLSTVLLEEVENARDRYEHATFSLRVPDDVYVEADDFATELFANLLSNAVVHNDASTPEVSVEAHRSGETAVVRVADNGPGIPDEQKRRVLEWKAKMADSQGMGLGLAIANTVVDRYGGSLRIEDNDPRGTVVNVVLPLAD